MPLRGNLQRLVKQTTTPKHTHSSGRSPRQHAQQPCAGMVDQFVFRAPQPLCVHTSELVSTTMWLRQKMQWIDRSTSEPLPQYIAVVVLNLCAEQMSTPMCTHTHTHTHTHTPTRPWGDHCGTQTTHLARSVRSAQAQMWGTKTEQSNHIWPKSGAPRSIGREHCWPKWRIKKGGGRDAERTWAHCGPVILSTMLSLL